MYQFSIIISPPQVTGVSEVSVDALRTSDSLSLLYKS